MDHKFTEEIGRWLETPKSELDYMVVSLLLYRLSGNQENGMSQLLKGVFNPNI